MNGEQCLGENPFYCVPIQAVKALANGVVRMWRSALTALSQFG